MMKYFMYGKRSPNLWLAYLHQISASSQCDKAGALFVKLT
jgi:hypothetical protein